MTVRVCLVTCLTKDQSDLFESLVFANFHGKNLNIFVSCVVF